MQTPDSLLAIAKWRNFVDAIQVIVEESYPGQFSYYFSHPVAGIDNSFRGFFPSREAAMESGQSVIKLKYPEPYAD